MSDSCDHMDCSLPGSSVVEVLQARILEWVAISFSRGSSWPRDQTQVSCAAGRFFTNWATREVAYVSLLEICMPLPFDWVKRVLVRETGLKLHLQQKGKLCGKSCDLGEHDFGRSINLESKLCSTVIYTDLEWRWSVLRQCVDHCQFILF